MRIAVLLTIISFSGFGQEIREYLDLQIHPTMHVRYGFFGDGLQWIKEGKEPNLKHKHLLKNVNYADYLYQNKGARIFIIGFIGSDGPTSRKKAFQSILDQKDHVDHFIAENSDKFALAKSPKEVRSLVHNTDKTIFIYSIESAKKLIDTFEDAQFWAKQGIAFITPIHLVDCEYGGAGTAPRMITRLINLKGVFRQAFASKKRGLTEHGKRVILWIHQAGMLTDLTHMSDLSRHDALDVMEKHGISPLATHDHFKPFFNAPRSIDTNDVLRIYKLGGFMSLACNGFSLQPHKPYPAYQKLIDEYPGYENGTIDTYHLVYRTLNEFVARNINTILGPEKTDIFENLDEDDKVMLSVGMQSDFNGWVNHTKPKFGSKKTIANAGNKTLTTFDMKGLAHPGLIGQQFKALENKGANLDPILRASERFLQIWEKTQNNSNLKAPPSGG